MTMYNWLDVGQCSFCRFRWLGYWIGDDRQGRPVFMCEDCREALPLLASPALPPPARIGPAQERRLPAATRKAGGGA